MCDQVKALGDQRAVIGGKQGKIGAFRELESDLPLRCIACLRVLDMPPWPGALNGVHVVSALRAPVGHARRLKPRTSRYNPRFCAVTLMPDACFHLIDDPTPDAPWRHACVLCERAWRAGARVFVLCEDADAARRFDALLWAFRADSFVPHGLYAEAPDDPVCIGDVPPAGGFAVLVNLSGRLLGAGFAQVHELVGPSEDARQAGRERYAAWRREGYAMTHVRVDAVPSN